MDELLTLDEVATMLRTPPATLRYWRHKQSGPPAIKLGRRLVYRAGDVRAWVDRQAAA